jgi:hypothetical protein
MAKHKFTVGQSVVYAPGRMGHPVGRTSCQIVRLLPADNVGDLQYRIKCVADSSERIATENQLSASF